MSLSDYFENTKGTGILSTADADGKVNAAVYSRPHLFDDGALGFIMRERLTHANLQQNPQASYLFMEADNPRQGKRLYLKKRSEEKETDRLYQLKRRHRSAPDDQEKGPKYLVLFELVDTLPLIGDKYPGETGNGNGNSNG